MTLDEQDALSHHEPRRKSRGTRSTEEVNLDLERAVQMRTADLARKNRELAETLDKLTHAQKQIMRSEKLASIGQLVAGIAHEINNPVNAIVNTVGPLEEAVGEIDSQDPTTRADAAKDVREMVKVVQRGAQRIKAIVSALHNYSRTDDESYAQANRGNLELFHGHSRSRERWDAASSIPYTVPSNRSHRSPTSQPHGAPSHALLSISWTSIRP